MKDYEQTIAAMTRQEVNNCLLEIATAFDRSQSRTDVYYAILDILHGFDLDSNTDDEEDDQ